jgi:putative transposase
MHCLTAYELKKRYEIDGPIWQSAYHNKTLGRDEDIRSVARYIIAHPLRAELVERIGEYSHWNATWL